MNLLPEIIPVNHLIIPFLPWAEIIEQVGEIHYILARVHVLEKLEQGPQRADITIKSQIDEMREFTFPNWHFRG